jgi:hypothetical protein
VATKNLAGDVKVVAMVFRLILKVKVLERSDET